MYAIVQTGGKQYRVQEGDQITVEKLAGDVGAKVTLAEVLLVRKDKETLVGTLQVANAKVEAKVVAQDKGEKITVFKKKRRKGYKKKQGHRQLQTTLKITKISG
jgi:large subunit ribosomal protein L21